MIPLRVTLEGFMSYRERQTLDFSGQSLWVLAGANGAGKSAVFDAISFALYGRYRGGAQNAENLINHDSSGLVVELEFKAVDRAYKVRRTLPRKGRATWSAAELRAGKWERIENADSLSDSEGFCKRIIGLSHEAFFSSVLLLQGQSDKLLRAQPAERYAILAELIDLVPYQRLAERAEALCELQAAERQGLDRALAGLPEVSETDLEQARANDQRCRQHYTDADQQVEHWVKLLEGAQTYQSLLAQRDNKLAQQGLDRALLARAQQIREGVAQFQQLDAVIDRLKEICELSQWLATEEQRLAAQQSAVAEEEQRAAALAEEQARCARQQADLTRQQDTLHSELEVLQRRLLEVVPLAKELEQLEEKQRDIGLLDAQLVDFPCDLAEQLRQAQLELEQLDEAKAAHLSLQLLVQLRRDLLAACENAAAAKSNHDAAQNELRQREGTAQQLALQAETTKAQVQELQQTLTRLETHRQATHEQLDRFDAIATAMQCTLCGQPIDEQHASKERLRLRELLAQLRAELLDVERRARITSEELTRWQRELKQEERALVQLQQQLELHSSRAREQQARSVQLEESLAQAFQQLPMQYRTEVWTAPLPVAWAQTRYPTSVDLEELQRRGEQKAGHGRKVARLREQHGKWADLDSQRKRLQLDLQRGRERYPQSTLSQARGEETVLQQEYDDKRTQQAERQHQQRDLATLHSQRQRELDTLQHALRAQQTALAGRLAVHRERQEQKRKLLAGLPRVWQTQALQLNEETLAPLLDQHAQLARFLKEEAELIRAQHAREQLEAQLAALEQQLAATPEPVRQPLAAVQESLLAARAERAQADARRADAQQRLAECERIRERRKQYEAEFKEKERTHLLYRRLAKLLGRDQLQRHLLQDAEQEIVRLANETLAGLSRGRMELLLRSEGSTQEAGKRTERKREKALDLLFKNTETGRHAMDAALASGSQGFRIAISLALAIGRYFGHDTHRVESVIIDEGFGCLDKATREDTIEVLRSLQKELRCIILVSHQDEFAAEFRNGYEIRLEDRTSVPRRMSG
jgi:DNA repair exonuclease SbcCD ATPase subunit